MPRQPLLPVPVLLPRQGTPKHLERRERGQADDLELEARLGRADGAGEHADGWNVPSDSELAGFREGPRGDLGGPLGEEGRSLGLGAEPVSFGRRGFFFLRLEFLASKRASDVRPKNQCSLSNLPRVQAPASGHAPDVTVTVASR